MIDRVPVPNMTRRAGAASGARGGDSCMSSETASHTDGEKSNRKRQSHDEDGGMMMMMMRRPMGSRCDFCKQKTCDARTGDKNNSRFSLP